MRTVPNDRYRLDFPSRAEQCGYSCLQRVAASMIAGPYHLTISHRHKFIWFRVAKVGTRTIFKHFKNQHVELSAKEPSFVRYCPRLYTKYFKFAFVRHPWDRLVSCWHNKVLDEDHFELEQNQLDELKTFAKFVAFVEREDLHHRDRHVQLQVELINLPDLDFLGRMETFAEDFAKVCDQIGIEGDRVARQNVSAKRRSYREYYTPELRDRVGRIYERDVGTFGYHF